jgi:phosphatidate cytidylyltransferase
MLGGTALAFLVAWIFRDAFLRDACTRQEIFIYAAVIAVSAQSSDLIESLLKRSFGVKDSSELLPGHGGFLDRFDSFIFAAPLFYYSLLLTGRFQ